MCHPNWVTFLGAPPFWGRPQIGACPHSGGALQEPPKKEKYLFFHSCADPLSFALASPFLSQDEGLLFSRICPCPHSGGCPQDGGSPQIGGAPRMRRSFHNVQECINYSRTISSAWCRGGAPPSAPSPFPISTLLWWCSSYYHFIIIFYLYHLFVIQKRGLPPNWGRPQLCHPNWATFLGAPPFWGRPQSCHPNWVTFLGAPPIWGRPHSGGAHNCATQTGSLFWGRPQSGGAPRLGAPPEK